MVAWVFWVITFDYSPNSPCFILHCISHGLWVFSGTLLYFFFIYRLYLVYNSTTNNIFGVRMCNYFVLIVLNCIYFASLIITLTSWIWYDPFLYAISHGTCLILEILMAVIISTLLIKPLLSKNNANSSIKKSASIVYTLTKLSILSVTSLGSTSILRIWLVLTFIFCPEECWLTFVMYATWSCDSTINIFSILCSFKTGDKYYQKYCSCLHQWVTTKRNNNDNNDNNINNNDGKDQVEATTLNAV